LPNTLFICIIENIFSNCKKKLVWEIKYVSPSCGLFLFLFLLLKQATAIFNILAQLSVYASEIEKLIFTEKKSDNFLFIFSSIL